jgi:sortase family protein
MKKQIKIILILLSIIFLFLVGFYIKESIRNRQINDKLKTIASSEVKSEPQTEQEIEQETIQNEVKASQSEILDTESQTELETNLETKEDTQNKVVTNGIEHVNVPTTFNKEVSFQNLHNENNDYLFWLYIPKTKIDYPVMMSRDNKDYLHSSFYKEKLYAGTLFIDALSSKRENQDNLIIYGHNMKDGSMFGTLKKWRSKKYFNEHKFIEIYTETEKRVYLIFAVREVSSNMDLLHYKLDGFTNEEYIQDARNNNIHFREFEDQYKNNQIMTLSTCMSNDAKRLIINAVLLYKTDL